MKVLVTGGAGFIGGNLVRLLLAKGYDVRCLVRRQSSQQNLRGLDVEIAYGDICDPDSLGSIFKGVDRLYHAAAYYQLWDPDPHKFYDINVKGTENILEAARRAGVSKTVYTSTVGAVKYPDDPEYPSKENDFPSKKDLHNDYKRSKFQAEAVAMRYAEEGFPVVVVNPSAPVGPFDVKPTPTGKIILDFLKGKIPAYVHTGLNIVDVEDVVQGHWLAMEKGVAGERYILGNKNMTLKAIYGVLATLTKRHPPAFRVPYSLALTLAYGSEGIAGLTGKRPRVPIGAVRMAKKFMYFDSSKAVRELGLPQSPVEQAFQRAVSWFRENRYV